MSASFLAYGITLAEEANPKATEFPELQQLHAAEDRLVAVRKCAAQLDNLHEYFPSDDHINGSGPQAARTNKLLGEAYRRTEDAAWILEENAFALELQWYAFLAKLPEKEIPSLHDRVASMFAGEWGEEVEVLKFAKTVERYHLDLARDFPVMKERWGIVTFADLDHSGRKKVLLQTAAAYVGLVVLDPAWVDEERESFHTKVAESQVVLEQCKRELSRISVKAGPDAGPKIVVVNDDWPHDSKAVSFLRTTYAITCQESALQVVQQVEVRLPMEEYFRAMYGPAPGRR